MSFSQSTSTAVNPHTVVIGAGPCGLRIARGLLSSSSAAPVLVLEKSRGLGGRCATRRVNEFSFDHGCQIIPDSLYPSSYPFRRPTGGFRTLAKEWAQGLNIEFETRLHIIERLSSGFRLQVTEPANSDLSAGSASARSPFTDSRRTIDCHRIILTCPLPQSLQILRDSGLPYEPGLDSIIYSKSVVGMFLLPADVVPADVVPAAVVSPNFSLYPDSLNHPDVEFFLPQHRSTSAMGSETSSVAPWILTLHGNISEQIFERAEHDQAKVLAQRLADLLRGHPSTIHPNVTKTQTTPISVKPVSVKPVSIKKWRYSRPMTSAPRTAMAPLPNLFLSGDAFGDLDVATRMSNLSSAFQAADRTLELINYR
jgi:hypothetical protein